MRPLILGQSSVVWLALLIAFLVAYGNVASVVLVDAPPAGAWPGIIVGVLLTLVMGAWARGAALTLADIGLVNQNAWRSAGVGLLVAGVAALAALALLRFPPLLGEPVNYAPIGILPIDTMAWRLLVWMPLDTALPEEVAFRGVLLGALRRKFSVLPAVLMSSAAFLLWHLVIVRRTLATTNLEADPLLLSLGFLGSMVAVFVGGVLFAAIRVWTGNLAGSIVAHWGFNAVLLGGLFLLH